MARWFVNPKRRRRGGGRQHRPRVRLSGHTFVLGRRSRWKGKVTRVNHPIINPFIREVRMGRNPRRRRRSRRNPSIIRNPGNALTLQGVMRNPVGVITDGFTAVTAAYLTVGIPNMFGLFMGPDLFSKLLRGVSRVVVGGFVYGAAKAVVPRSAGAAAIGAAVGSVGAFTLDVLGTRLILGSGDTTQTPMTLLASIQMPALAGYTRPMGGYRGYVRPMGGFRGIYGGTSMGMTRSGASIY
jgi:hypothetical protein